MARQLLQLYNWWPGSYYSSTTGGQAAITALKLVARQLLQLYNWWPGSYYSSTTGGQAAITDLQLVAKTDEVGIEKVDGKEKKISKRFSRSYTLAGEYEIKLLPNAKPHAIFTPRHAPLAVAT